MSAFLERVIAIVSDQIRTHRAPVVTNAAGEVITVVVDETDLRQRIAGGEALDHEEILREVD